MTIDPKIRQVVEVECSRQGLDVKTVTAQILKESGGNTWKCRYEPGWRLFNAPEMWAKMLGQSAATETNQQATSWGLMQIMGCTARDLGYSGLITELLIPDEGIHFGCMYLAKQLRRYGNYIDALGAYNAGSVQRIGNKLVNQEYVDQIMEIKCGL